MKRNEKRREIREKVAKGKVRKLQPPSFRTWTEAQLHGHTLTDDGQ